MSYRLGVDIGGTFTDAILWDDDGSPPRIAKVPSTPHDPAEGFVTAARQILRQAGLAPRDVGLIVHGTTVATNAIIEGKTARTAFVTTAGFRDMLEIQRQIRPSLYDLNFEKPRPLVPRDLCFEVVERLDARGAVIEPLDEADVRRVGDRLSNAAVASVAVCFLHAYRNPDHERRAGAILRAALPSASISLSSEVAPEFREYFRASTTVVNAAVRPVVEQYLSGIESKLAADGFRAPLLVMQSNGGVLTAGSARDRPVFMVESGPAAGVIAATYVAECIGHRDVISFDMGGTTAKAGLVCDGSPSITKEYEVGAQAGAGIGASRGSGYPIRTPVIDLVEIGAGGGSIAWVDSGGALRVGPKSAGAEPGPASYGRGGSEPTVTDANLVLGRLAPASFLGGALHLDSDAAWRAVDEHCARPLGLDVVAAAHGIVEIANAAMTNALHLVSIQRGHDPRDFVLIAFGGTGPLHANRLAAELPFCRGPTNHLAAQLFGSHTRMMHSMTRPDGEYGVVLARDVSVPMRDGVSLAADIYRPARAGEPLAGAWPTILGRTSYGKAADWLWVEPVANFFAPRGFVVVVQDMRGRGKSGGTGEYFHTATLKDGFDGYDTVEWIAQQAWSNGRIATVGSSHGAMVQTAMALKRPPHLSAIWPDVGPINSYAHQAREGGAMQLHMFGAQFLHAHDAQEIRDDPAAQAALWDAMGHLREWVFRTPFKPGHTPLRVVPNLEQTLFDYYWRGEYDDYWKAEYNDYSRYFHQHADVPGTFTSGWYDPYAVATTSHFAAMVKQNASPQRLIVGPWTHDSMRNGVSWAGDVDFGADSVWGLPRYQSELLRWFERWLLDVPTGVEADPPVRIFVMGGGSGRKTATGRLHHGGHWRDEQEWPLARTSHVAYYLHADGSLSAEAPAIDRCALSYSHDPAHPVPTIAANVTGFFEMVPVGDGIEPAMARFVPGRVRMRSIVTPGAADQREAPHILGAQSPYFPLATRPDVLVFQTPPLNHPPRDHRGQHRQAVDLVIRSGYGLHRQARRRVPGDRGVSGGLRDESRGFHHSHALSQWLGKGRAHATR